MDLRLEAIEGGSRVVNAIRAGDTTSCVCSVSSRVLRANHEGIVEISFRGFLVAHDQVTKASTQTHEGLPYRTNESVRRCGTSHSGAVWSGRRRFACLLTRNCIEIKLVDESSFESTTQVLITPEAKSATFFRIVLET